MFDAATGEHIYVSTACLHDRHPLCRRACKYCSTPCWCACHPPTQPLEDHVSEQQPEQIDNPATPDVDLDDEQDPVEAQQRDEDPDGDPDAEDLGAAEDPADTDPEPVLPDSAGDPLDDLQDGEDNDDDLDGDDGQEDGDGSA